MVVEYYWQGLDYLKWVLGAAGVGCFLAMLPEPTGRKRGWLKLFGCVLVGAGTFCAALGGVLFNLRAPMVEDEGVVAGVYVSGGKGAHTDFGLLTSHGEIDGLSISGAVKWIHDGDAVVVTYQDGSHAVVGIRVVSGAAIGWTATGETGALGAWLGLVASVGLMGYGVADWFNDGTAIPSQPDDSAAVNGEVDSASLLNLSGRE